MSWMLDVIAVLAFAVLGLFLLLAAIAIIVAIVLMGIAVYHVFRD